MRREAKLLLCLTRISFKPVLNPAIILADFTATEQVCNTKHHPQLPGHGQGQTKPSFLSGLSEQCNQSQKHGAGGEISS